jgi:hypothetical protein
VLLFDEVEKNDDVALERDDYAIVAGIPLLRDFS